MTLTYRGQKYNQNNAAASNVQRRFLFIAVRSRHDNSTTPYKPAEAGLFLWLICLQDRAVCLQRSNQTATAKTLPRQSSTNRHTNFHRHQHHLLLPQIIGQERH